MLLKLLYTQPEIAYFEVLHELFLIYMNQRYGIGGMSPQIISDNFQGTRGPMVMDAECKNFEKSN